MRAVLRRSVLVRVGRVLLAMALLAAALIIFFTATPQGKAAFRAALFVAQILDVPIKPQPWFTGDPVRHEVTYRQDIGTGVADIYRIPDGKRRAAVLLFLGANAAGRDDEDVVNLGEALARSGFVTMIYWSPTMALQNNIDPAEIDNLVQAFQFLEQQQWVEADRVGIGGFCVGASFSLVAAADPRISDRVQFVNAFGPYFDAKDLLIQVSSRSRLDRGERTPWEPDPLTLKVFANELIEALDDPADKELLTKVYITGELVDLSTLTSAGQTVARLIGGAPPPEEAAELYVTLPKDFRDAMDRISPSRYVNDLQAKLLILHDRDDRLVPSAESRRLAAAMEERGDVRYTELLSFDHVRPTSGTGIWRGIKEGFKLYGHMYKVMRAGT
ncbi:MAG: hypothetical protein BZY87_08740 [SAR202 cluster bacterium Io17-Chloro-G6]|nr:MAG: hypothetical protein BZY87_08740 [SAR202 cluster bacterium Io17-Chloro-G6]